MPLRTHFRLCYPPGPHPHQTLLLWLARGIPMPYEGCGKGSWEESLLLSDDQARAHASESASLALLAKRHRSCTRQVGGVGKHLKLQARERRINEHFQETARRELPENFSLLSFPPREKKRKNSFISRDFLRISLPRLKKKTSWSGCPWKAPGFVPGTNPGLLLILHRQSSIYWQCKRGSKA